MRLATYNMFYGINGNYFHNHIGVFVFLRSMNDFERVKNFSKYLGKVFEMIDDINCDILCLNEVLYDMNKDIIELNLKKLGFITFSWGIPKGFVFPLRRATLVAVKSLGNSRNLELPHSDKIGGCGDICCVEIKYENFAVIGCHLASSNFNNMKKDQINVLYNYVSDFKDSGYNVIVMGDFNSRPSRIKGFLENSGLKIAKVNHTHPNIYGLNLFYKSHIDHICMPKEWVIINSFTVKGNSDHLMLVADVEVK